MEQAEKREPKVPEDFHALYSPGARAARGVPAMPTTPIETGSLSSFAEEAPNLVIDYDDATQRPVLIAGQEPEARLSGPVPGTPEEAVDAFIQSRSDIWGLATEDAATVEVQSVSRRGLPTVRLIQRVDGVEVFDSEVSVALTPDNQIISVAGQLFPGTAAPAVPARAGASLSAEAAIAMAASDLTGMAYTADDVAPVVAERESGPYRFYEGRVGDGDSRPAFERPVRVKDVLFPLGDGQFAPGYYLELWIRGYPAFAYVIDNVDTPDVLFRKNLTSPAAFRYRVHNTMDAIVRPEDGPAPGSPHPTGVPNGFQAPTIAEQVITIESLLPGDPWLPDGATTTRGNNCIAYADLKPPDGFSEGDVLGKITSPGAFEHTYDHSTSAATPDNLQASVVGMFFHVNWLHDRWYEAGFDEAAGNAQMDNFGRGGLDGDPVLAEANDFSGTDNANMATPADGSSPRMQMFVFAGVPSPLPSRNSNFEALITFHEMGHYVTNRLVGNAAGLTNQQGRSMGEGWGDFFAVCMTSQASDDFANGAFPIGGWTDLVAGFNDNYYFSIRRYPCSADMAKNPLTFQHISANVLLPVGPPRNPFFGGGPNEEVHNAGEVWCCALWEVFVNLVAEYGHEEAERRMLLYVIGGLKQTPSRPTFTQARDGIIATASGLNPGDLSLVWSGFAKRGMGRNAVSPPSSSGDLVGVVEDFTA
jgi:extracellular elastinolytic metalloproteinase